MYRVFIYRRTANLGDAIQTYALCRLLGNRCAGIYRDEPFPAKLRDTPLVANGWLGFGPPDPAEPAVFAGVHLGRCEAKYVRWLENAKQPIGVRDSYSQTLLRCNRIEAAIVGCATLTLDRYKGRRSGRYSIDVGPYEGTSFLTHRISDLSWQAQWLAACQQLDLLRKAELVVTNRLHAVLPCLAFGTPVVFPMADYQPVHNKQRLTLLNELPFAYDEVVQTDVSKVAERYLRHLSDSLGPVKFSRKVRMPEPL